MTQAQHLSKVTQWISQNQQSVGISPNTIYQFVDYANRRIWKVVAPKRPTDFQKEYTGIADGDRLPVDFGIYAGSANYTDGGGIVRPFHLVYPEQLSFEIDNFYGASRADYPGFYIEDMCVRTIPAGITGMKLRGFFQPVAMVGASSSTDDGMPVWVSDYVHMECAEALRELSMDEHKAEETLIRRMKEANDLDEKLSAYFDQAMQAGVRTTIKQ